MKDKHNQSLPKLSPIIQLLTYIGGKTYTHLISVAAKLGIADLLSNGPKSVEQLSIETDTHAPSLYRVLRVLDRMGVFSEEAPRVFSLTQISKFLKEDSPFSLKDWAILNGSEWNSRPWLNLLYSIKKGKPAFQEIYGMDLFEYFKKNQEEFDIYNNAMTFFSRVQATIIVDSYDFSNFKTIVDVGGGHGILLASILKKNSSLQGILYELPEVARGAQKTMEKENLLERCKIIEGDFFKSVPKGADAYIMKYIIHDWDDDKARLILKNCRENMASNGRLLVVDRVISLKSGLQDEVAVDIEMMLLTEGRERTESEFQQLFTSSGFKLIKIITTQLPLYILEVEPI